MRPFLLVLCLLAATACDENSPTGPSGPLNERLTLAPGQQSDVTGAGFALRFVRVTGDSRCPADAVCILGGDAIVEVQVTNTSGGSREYELHTGDQARASVTHEQTRITLVELAPYPFSSQPIQPGEYRATFEVTRP